jgi:hypothetical protein
VVLADRRMTTAVVKVVDCRVWDLHVSPYASTTHQAVRRATHQVVHRHLGEGAALWLKEAGAAGASRVRTKMADAVALAKLAGVEAVDWALGHAAIYGRFAEGDLASIVAHHAGGGDGEVHRASESRSLQTATSAWEGFGR